MSDDDARQERKRQLHRARVDRYQEKHKEKIAAKAKEKYQANPEKWVQYQEANKEKRNAQKRLRRQQMDPAKKKAIREAYLARHPEAKEQARARARAYQKRDRQANPEKYRQQKQQSWFKSNYGITLEERNGMIRAQGERCLCCKTLFGILWETKACVDHCHSTGRVRGILCGRCNFLLGHANDQPAILRACARYLKQFASNDAEEA